MTPLSDLLARVEAATGGDRELDGEMWVTLMWTRENTDPCFYELLDEGRWREALHSVQPNWRERDWVPRYTSSLDAALGLVERMLPGSYSGLQQNRGENVPAWSGYVDSGDEHEGWGASAALALLAAMLRALLSSEAPRQQSEAKPSAGKDARDEHVNNLAKTKHVPPTCKEPSHIDNQLARNPGALPEGTDHV